MTMCEDILKYPIFVLTKNGELKQTSKITSTADYNHFKYHLHHYIKQQDFKRNEKWFEEKGIKQKLILLPIFIHEQVHCIGVNNFSDEGFKKRFKISRWQLIFNRKRTIY